MKTSVTVRVARAFESHLSNVNRHTLRQIQARRLVLYRHCSFTVESVFPLGLTVAKEWPCNVVQILSRTGNLLH